MQAFSFPRKSAERIFAAQQRFTFGESEPLAPKRYRAGWISDAHLGTRGCNAAALLDFLRGNDFETLYIVGDLIDIWSLLRGIYWPQQRSDVIQKEARLTKLMSGFHSAAIREFGNVTYYNCGDWVESCTALVEGDDGILSMVNYHPSSAVRPDQGNEVSRSHKLG